MLRTKWSSNIRVERDFWTWMLQRKQKARLQMPAQQKLSERIIQTKGSGGEREKTEMNKGKATSSILRMLILLTASFKYHCCRPPYVSPQLLLALQTQPESNCPWGELVLEGALWRRSPLDVCYATRRSTYIHLSHSLFSRPLQIKPALGEPIWSL